MFSHYILHLNSALFGILRNFFQKPASHLSLYIMHEQVFFGVHPETFSKKTLIYYILHLNAAPFGKPPKMFESRAACPSSNTFVNASIYMYI
jgi:hypothetical protein